MSENRAYERQAEIGRELVEKLVPAVDAGQITPAEALEALTAWQYATLKGAAEKNSPNKKIRDRIKGRDANNPIQGKIGVGPFQPK